MIKFNDQLPMTKFNFQGKTVGIRFSREVSIIVLKARLVIAQLFKAGFWNSQEDPGAGPK
jgi:hypothetical protein